MPHDSAARGDDYATTPNRTDRGIGVGVMLPRDLPADQVLAFARRADELGFDELWVVEDLGFHGGIAQAATALAATSQIRVGIGVLPVAVRNVGFAAMEIATLAAMFPGRLDVGLGHGLPGWIRQVGAWPASPLTLLREQATALRALLGGETVSADGRYVKLDRVRIEQPPAVVPPILAGVRGPRSLALAGEVADGTVLAEPITPEYLAVTLERIGAAPERPGRPGHRVITYNVAHVDDDADAARRAVRPGLEWVGEPDWAVHIDPLPFAAEFRDLRASSADREDFTRRLPDEWVDRLTISGPPEAARRRLAEQRDAGVTTAVLIPSAPDPLAALTPLSTLLQQAPHPPS